MKKMLRTNLVLAMLLLFQLNGIAQNTTECPDCPNYFSAIVSDGIVTSEIVIPEQDFDDLGVSPLQSVCFDIEHPYLSDIFIVLESPSGKKYFLMGDDGNNEGECDTEEKHANVCFVLGSDKPLTEGSSYQNYCGSDPNYCLTGDWTLSCGNAMVSDLLEGVTASPNCDLDDFNVAGDPISGTWRALIGCVCGFGEDATLTNWSLNFEVPASQIPCIGSKTTSASLAYQPCETDDLTFNASNGLEYYWTGPNGFASASGIISVPNFSDDLAGLYSCKIVTENECYDLHEIEVENICEKSATKIYRNETKEICVAELLDAGFVNAFSSEFLDITVNDNCLSIAANAPGVDSVFVLERVGGEDIYTRYTVEVLEESGGKKSFPADWQMSPNPTTGILKLVTPLVSPRGITIMNLQGVVLKTFAAEGEITLLDISEFARGVYIVRVNTDKGVFNRRTILVD